MKNITRIIPVFLVVMAALLACEREKGTKIESPPPVDTSSTRSVQVMKEDVKENLVRIRGRFMHVKA